MPKGINVENTVPLATILITVGMYAHERNLLRSLTCKLRSEYENSIARNMKCNPKAFWSYVNSKTKTKTSLPTLISHNSTEASSDADKAAVLNQFSVVFSLRNPYTIFQNFLLESLLIKWTKFT